LVLIPYTVFAAQVGDERRRQYAASSLLQSSLTSFAFVALLAMFATVAAVTFTLPHLAPVLAMLLLAVPATMLRDFARRFAFANLRMDRALVLDGAVTVAQLALLAWLAVLGKLSAVTGVAAWGAACGTVAAAWLWHSRGLFAFRHGAIRSDWRRNFFLGRWLLAGHVTGISQAYALHWLLALTLGVEATGAFAALTTLVALANPLIIGLGNFLMPATAHVFAGSGPEGVWRLAVRTTRGLVAALALFCLLVALAGNWALTLLYGERFGGQGLAVTLMALAAAVAALGIGAEHALRSMDRPRAVLLANLLALATTLALAAWLVPAHGLVGAACSLLAGNLVGCFVRWSAFAAILDFRLLILDSRLDHSTIQNAKSRIQNRVGGPLDE
jgi:O-antigen/teichoic acid export membrane protein